MSVITTVFSMKGDLHVVCLDAPSPPDYGGAIDIHYKIKALAAMGYGIRLHYFQYRQHRGADDLAPLCKSVHAYKRTTNLAGWWSRLPYIVHSRTNRQLIDRLNKDDHPVLLEGIHCTGIIPHLNNRDRTLVVRVHNDEALYYAGLARSEKHLLKKLYYRVESRLLQRYQSTLPPNVIYACLSTADRQRLQAQYRFPNVAFLPCFTAWDGVRILPGTGSYCLYHGNLGVPENSEAAQWLVEKVFAALPVPLVIAGKNPPGRLQQACRPFGHIRLAAGPDAAEMERLVQEAHINLVPSHNGTGVKLKLLHALLRGRHCITNTAGWEGSGIAGGLHRADTAEAVATAVQQLMGMPFTEVQIRERGSVLDLYDNRRNAEKLSGLLC